MKLLRNISMITLLALAVSACVKEVVTVPVSRDPGKVSFIPATYSAGTKVVSGNVFPTDQSFGCFAFYSPDGTTWGDYMDNEQVSYNSTESQWLPTLDYYWPRINRVSFLSYAPYSATPWITSATARTLVAANVTPQPTDDWMYADIAADYNANADGTDVTDDYTSGSDSGFDGVPTFFRHALTRIAINIKARTITPGSGTGTIVNIGDEYEGATSSTPWVEVSNTSTLDDDGIHAIRTVTTVRQRTETIQMSQTTVETEIDTPSGWTIKVTGVSFADAVTCGTMELEAETGHTFGTSERVELTGGWRPANSSSYGNIPLESLLVDANDDPVPLTDSYQPLIEERSMIPQTLDRITLLISYTSQINAADVIVTTTVNSWERTRTFTETHMVVTDLINNKVLQDETDETFVDTDGAKTASVTVETPQNHNAEVTFNKNIPFYGQGGLTEWAMNKKITYNISIEPTGKRITWDPAQVDDWGAHTTGGITLE